MGFDISIDIFVPKIYPIIYILLLCIKKTQCLVSSRISIHSVVLQIHSYLNDWDKIIELRRFASRYHKYVV